MKEVFTKILGLYHAGADAVTAVPFFEPAVRFITFPGPVQMLLLFFLSSMVMIWRLNAVEKKGFQGTMVGTLVMPYCSGFANLAFAFVMGRSGNGGGLVIENCIVNNLTNLTLILGIPALFRGLNLKQKTNDPEERIGYISLLLSLTALLFFTGAAWTLARDGRLDFSDGIMLCGLFGFWQIIHVFEVKKNNLRKSQSFRMSVLFDLGLAGLCAWATLHSIEGLVEWVAVNGKGILSMKYIGILSGLLMVVPNGVLALYYSASGRPDIAYSSQIGDSHICIPLCIGLYAMFSPIVLPPVFLPGIMAIAGAGMIHLFFTALFGRLPSLAGAGLSIGYMMFIFRGFHF
ncbi:sodium/calcium exchanger membrane region [Desulfospira joergensenii]|uniref:sodium/calcium exchanger membrane region n=1 Tax=Desulfospira joergensenii TaxID=53329 RepID=UPI0003B3DD39|nr:sodium/calcium exchanger membrane region [Desulfospira joergensenii]